MPYMTKWAALSSGRVVSTVGTLLRPPINRTTAAHRTAGAYAIARLTAPPWLNWEKCGDSGLCDKGCRAYYYCMAGKLSPAAQTQLLTYQGFNQLVGRINALVEQFATAKSGHENIRSALKRSAGQAKLQFMTSGLASLSQLSGAIEMTAGRGGPPGALARALREQVGQLKFGIELGIRTIMREDAELQQKKKLAKEAAARVNEHILREQEK